jgi:alpha-ribazole phosphatase
MRLILVRHPKPQCERGLCYGRLDLECEAQALEEAASRLSAVAASARVFTSPSRRARDLAARICSSPIAEPRLQELDFGDWEGRRWQDLGREAIDAWRRSLPDSAPPNGETLTGMAARCTAWLESLAQDARPILAVTHAGPIRVIKAILGGEPLLTHFAAPIPFAQPIEFKLK